MSKSSGGDAKYFTTTKKGEIAELKRDLHSNDRNVVKNAVKKVIALMTVGKDMSRIFEDVTLCMVTADVELKKLVYLYIMNYAKSKPDTAILAVNSFVKDASDHNPLIRALAVRTMGCIGVEQISEYLCEPLRRCLKDDDPYVRKTAVMTVAKMHEINPELVDDQGFVLHLRDLLQDPNAMVVANTVAALYEISDGCRIPSVFKVTKAVVKNLMAALTECTEWGQIFILDALSCYRTTNAMEAEGIAERVVPHLQHSNPAVVLSTVKVIMCLMNVISNNDFKKMLYKKIAAPLVTLLSGKPEIQYVALRNINLLVQKNPSILDKDIKFFFCKYNDPIYVKLEKLEIMTKMVSQANVNQVLLELKEYATEVDVEMVRRSVRAIGRCAIKLASAAERAINVLLELIRTKVQYVVQESVVVMKDIFRRYPNMYEVTISDLCDNLDTLDEPEAKASMIWIVGEYASRIDNADEILQIFLETWHDEAPQVQLQLLTAIVKLFLGNQAKGEQMCQDVLKLATEASDNPDLRDRAFVYWRLLTKHTEAAKKIILAKKPRIADDTAVLEPQILNNLLSHLSTLAATYHKPPSAFVRAKAVQASREYNDDDGDDGYGYNDEPTSSDNGSSSSGQNSQGQQQQQSSQQAGGDDDLLDMMGMMGVGGSTSQPAPVQTSNQPPQQQGFQQMQDSMPPAAPVPTPVQLAPLTQSNGITVSGGVGNGELVLEVQPPIQTIQLQFNKNLYGVGPQSTSHNVQGDGKFHCTFDYKDKLLNPGHNGAGLQVALREPGANKIVYFNVPLSRDFFKSFLSTQVSVDRKEYLDTWAAISDKTEVKGQVSPNLITSAQSLNLFLVATREANENRFFYYRGKSTLEGSDVLVEVHQAPMGTTASVRCTRASIAPIALKYLQQN